MSECNNLNLKLLFHLMLMCQVLIERIEGLCMKIPFPTLGTNLSFHIFYKIEFSIEPVLAFD